MKLPNSDLAYISNTKIDEYLLSPIHPDGKSKHDFFIRFGFHPHQGEKLVDALKQHALEHDVVRQEQTLFGIRYIIEGFLRCPDGRKPKVRVIWFINLEDDLPRLVTAYPMH